MEIGCNTVAFRSYSLDFALERIAKAGYRYVEVEGNLSWCPHVNIKNDDPIKFKEKIQSYGFVGVSGLGNHRELITREDGFQDILRALEWCHEAGIQVLSTGEGRKPDAMSTQEAMVILKDRLQALAETAQKNQVYLALEDHGSISLTPNGLPDILNLVQSDWIAVNFDTANIHRGDYVGTTSEGYEWKLEQATKYDELELLEKVVHRVKHTHIKDVVGRDAVTLGEGEVDILGCIKMLKTGGYAGVLSYETEGMQSPEDSFKMIENSKNYLEEALATTS